MARRVSSEVNRCCDWAAKPFSYGANAMSGCAGSFLHSSAKGEENGLLLRQGSGAVLRIHFPKWSDRAEESCLRQGLQFCIEPLEESRVDSDMIRNAGEGRFLSGVLAGSNRPLGDRKFLRLARA